MKFLIKIIFITAIIFNINSEIYIPSSSFNQVIEHKFYTLSYAEEYEQAEWVFYHLTDEMITGHFERTDNFREDILITTGSAELNDYSGSGYDRGHLAPAGDMAVDSTAMSESFYMSNMSPQHPSFNRGIWKKLESLIRAWAYNKSEIYVITGPVLNKQYIIDYIGENGVAVPQFYYKIAYTTEPDLDVIAFLLPNQKATDSIKNYVVTIDKIEDLSGIDFFAEVNDDLENEIESSIDISNWNFDAVYKKIHRIKTNRSLTSKTKIDLNNATISELTSLHGIGPAKAKAIIDNRPYNEINDLLKVKGIGNSTLKNIREFIHIKK